LREVIILQYKEKYTYGNGFKFLKQKNIIKMLREIIIKWKLNSGLLALKMGMSKGYFSNKLNEKKVNNFTYRFTPEELNKLKGILIELRNDLEAIDEIEFNQALEMLVKKEV